MDGKLRSDDTVSVEEWNDFVRGRRLLEPIREDSLRNEDSAPTAERSVMDLRQELFTREGMLMDSGCNTNLSGPISPESMSTENRCSMCNKETQY